MEIKLREYDFNIIKEHSMESFPEECCGILFGYINNYIFEVDEVVPAENEFNSSTSYRINPEFVYKKIDEAEDAGLELVGFYHSHPNMPAFASDRDLKYMVLWPEIAWLIISLGKENIFNLRVFVIKIHAGERKTREIKIDIL